MEKLIQFPKTSLGKLIMFRCVHNIKPNTNFVVSVSLFVWNNSAPTGRIFIKCDIQGIFQNLTTIFDFY